MDNRPNYYSRWQKRSQKFSAGLRAVLFQGLPNYLNVAIHNWHRRLIAQHMLPLLPYTSRVLDIGSGYGRLSHVIKEKRPDIKLIGIDFNLQFCQIYHHNIGASVCADVRNLPFSPCHSDGLLVVTALMYTKEDVLTVVQSVLAQLKPGGIALFIEPGSELIACINKLWPRFKRRTTGGQGFSQKDFLHLFSNTPCLVLGKGSNLIFTLVLPLLLIFGKISPLGTWLANVAVNLDIHLNIYGKFALHRWIMVQRL